MNILLAYQNNLCRSFLKNTLSGSEQFFSISLEALVGALRIMVAGETYFQKFFDNEGSVSSKDHFSRLLTNREKEVLNGLLYGQSNEEMARTHNLSEITIKHHLKSNRSKLGAKNRTHAVCRAIELGLASDAQPPMMSMV